MDLSTSTTLLLDRPSRTGRPSAVATERAVDSEAAAPPIGMAVQPDAAIGPASQVNSFGSLLRAPGLAVLATVFLVEGYGWLGVLHLKGSGVGSVVFGTVGLAVTAFLAPSAALVLQTGRQPSGRMVEDLVIVVAMAVTVATVAALILADPVGRAVAGSADILLAATALTAVVLGERARRHGSDPPWASTPSDHRPPVR